MPMHLRNTKNASTVCGTRTGERTLMRARVTCKACLAADRTATALAAFKYAACRVVDIMDRAGHLLAGYRRANAWPYDPETNAMWLANHLLELANERLERAKAELLAARAAELKPARKPSRCRRSSCELTHCAAMHHVADDARTCTACAAAGLCDGCGQRAHPKESCDEAGSALDAIRTAERRAGWDANP